MKVMNFKSAVLFAVAILFLGSCGLTPREPAQIELRIMETTDIHAHLLGYNYFAAEDTAEYGFAHTAHLIKQARAEQANHLLFDNGDLIQGSPLGDWIAKSGNIALEEQVHPVIDALNYLNYDAANIGNHEFNFGLEFLEQTLSGANFPYVTANAFYIEGEPNENDGWRTQGWDNPIRPPYVILEREFKDTAGRSHTLNIGVIGFVPPQILTWDAMNLAGRVYVRDMVAAAQHFVPKMRAEGADLVIAIPHAGINDSARYTEFTEQATREIARVPGIDAILFGHQHQIFPGSPSYDNIPGVDNVAGTIHGVPSVQPGYWGSHLGLIDMVLEQSGDSWVVQRSQVELREITDQVDLEFAARVQAVHQKTVDMLNEPLAPLTTPITSYLARMAPDTATQFINEAQQWYGQKLQRLGELPQDLPVLSTASPFRTGHQNAEDYVHIEEGQVTLGDLAGLYVYPNTLQAMVVNGAQLKEWLEMSAIAFATFEAGVQDQPLLARTPSFNFDSILGLKWTYDLRQPPRYNREGEVIDDDAYRVMNLTYNGNPVRDNQEFILMVNNYRAGGGGNFPNVDASMLVYQGADEIRQIIADYARDVAEKDGQLSLTRDASWSFILPENSSVLFTSGHNETVLEEINWVSGATFIGLNEEGYGLYRITSED
ncbi:MULTISPECIES: bifunctional 2',3'-cyclic-nucleotide 2'-phosphodiesterase/3'-nucleotidase [Gammaproteobacteria]|uniref:bifunctional 2',3'-cyclic-nucleotide 2'-phosphodiesterase/3'-nucleotidase n=1 Tax=Gammaproteobacteria TaxID=1236 RepID=UPI0014025366|nr:MULTISPECIES: bifunctional 2',3'-cyclic-nucleotide 2'-phosphodiesterase/3'-nucleotidase [Gammaproteobacteria]